MGGILPMPVAGALHALEGLGHALDARRALGQAIEADEDPPPAERDESHALALARPPADRVAGRNVEVHAPRAGTVEHESPVHLEEWEMGADEDRVVGAVEDVDLRGAPARVDGNGPLPVADLSRLHHAPPALAGVADPIGRST